MSFKRKTALALVILLVVLSCCVMFSCETAPDNTILPDVPPDTIPDEDNPTDNIDVNPDECAPKEALYATLSTMNKSIGFRSECTGKTTAKKGISYDQDFIGCTVKNGNSFYNESYSTSLFVKVRHESFSQGDKICYRKNRGDIEVNSREDYVEIYGITPDKLLCGYLLNDQTIVSAEFVGEENGLYTFRYALSKDLAHALLVKQMKQFGGLNSYPVFTQDTVITLTITKNYVPVSLTTLSNYNINVAILGEMNCNESMTVNFVEFNVNSVIPDIDDFTAACVE